MTICLKIIMAVMIFGELIENGEYPSCENRKNLEKILKILDKLKRFR